MLTRMSKLSPVFSVCLHGLKGRLLVPYKRPPQNVNPLRDYPAHPPGGTLAICAEVAAIRLK